MAKYVGYLNVTKHENYRSFFPHHGAENNELSRFRSRSSKLFKDGASWKHGGLCLCICHTNNFDRIFNFMSLVQKKNYCNYVRFHIELQWFCIKPSICFWPLGDQPRSACWRKQQRCEHSRRSAEVSTCLDICRKRSHLQHERRNVYLFIYLFISFHSISVFVRSFGSLRVCLV